MTTSEFQSEMKSALAERHMKTMMLAGIDRTGVVLIVYDLLKDETSVHRCNLLLQWIDRREREVREDLISLAIQRATAAMQKRDWATAFAAFDQVDMLEGKPRRTP